MGGRANPLRDAAAMRGTGQTEFAKQIGRTKAQWAAVAVVAALRGTCTSQVQGAQTCLVTSGKYVPTSAVVLRAA